MKLIADSGSTRTSWRCCGETGNILQFTTEGLNPYFTDPHHMNEIIHKQLIASIGFPGVKHISSVHFYGSGCSSAEKISEVQKTLSGIFTNAKIEVASDLLGAARGTCGHQAGIAAILGTGSNSCEYDGEKMVGSQTSLGYVLGDEGSGAHLGKKLLRAFYYGEMPEHLAAALKKKTGSLSGVLENIYKKPFPNRYIASYSRFLQHHIKDPWCKKLIHDSFSEFLEIHITRYNFSKLPLHIAGSVGYYFGSILTSAAASKNITTGTIVESPIAGLVLYHLDEI